MNEIEIGKFSEKVVNALGLNISVGTSILLSNSTIEHMKDRHIEDFSRFSVFVGKILLEPDLVGVRPTDKTISFVKFLDNEYVCVPVRPSADTKYFVRTLFVLQRKTVAKFLERKTLVKLTND